MTHSINLHINTNKLLQNVQENLQENLVALKLGLKHIIPYSLAAMVFWDLSERALQIPNPTAAWATSNLMWVGKIACIVKGALDFHQAALSYVTSPKKNVVPIPANSTQLHRNNLNNRL